MIVYPYGWTRVEVSCAEFNDVAHDSIIPIEFVLQGGEAKITLNSEKFVLRGQLFVLKGKTVVPYLIHLKNIDAMSFMTEGGHCELYVTSIARSETELKITGCNGFMSFQGQNLDLAFLRADGHGWALTPVEEGGKCFAEMQRDT